MLVGEWESNSDPQDLTICLPDKENADRTEKQQIFGTDCLLLGAAAAISHPAVLMQAELSLGIHEKALPIQERPSQPFIADKFAKQRMIRHERCIQLTEGREEFQKAPGLPIGRAILGYFL